MFAAANGEAECVRLLIDAGADKNAKNDVRRWSLLCWGASMFLFHLQGYSITFQFFICVTLFRFLFKNIMICLLRASFLFFPFPCVVAHLLARLLKFVFSFQRLCCVYMHLTCVRWRLCCMGGGESDSQLGWAALIYAAESGHAECARLLIDAGADKDAKNDVRVGHCFAEAQSYVY